MPLVVLSRSEASTPWGFRLHGGKDFGAPLTVQRINPGSVASKCGLLIGDVIQKIGATAASDLKHKDAQDLIAKGGNNIELTISRGQDIGYHASAKSTDIANNNETRTTNVLSYAPKPHMSESTYEQHLEKATVDTASLNIRKYEPEVETKWEAPFLRGASGPPTGGYNPGGETKKYIPSETCKLVRDMEAGHEASYNPMTGAEKKPAPAQSKLVDYLDKKCGEAGTNPPTGSWVSPASGNRTAAASSYRFPAASSVSPSGVRAPSEKPGDFRGIPASGASARPQEPKKLTHLEEALSMPAFAGGNIPVCNVDNMPIKGPYVTAVNKIWCQEHFVCSNPSCHQSLTESGFVEEDGQLFCKQDYEQYFAPRCAKCELPIVGDTVKALQKTYHPSCFLCSHCHQPILGGLFHLEKGEPYCEKDWATFFQSKCHGCQFPIEMGDTWIEALGKNWHAECFNCTTCHVNLESQGFVNRGGRPYCKDHARV